MGQSFGFCKHAAFFNEMRWVCSYCLLVKEEPGACLLGVENESAVYIKTLGNLSVFPGRQLST